MLVERTTLTLQISRFSRPNTINTDAGNTRPNTNTDARPNTNTDKQRHERTLALVYEPPLSSCVATFLFLKLSSIGFAWIYSTTKSFSMFRIEDNDEESVGTILKLSTDQSGPQQICQRRTGILQTISPAFLSAVSSHAFSSGNILNSPHISQSHSTSVRGGLVVYKQYRLNWVLKFIYTQ